ncbi:MAG: 30S ribosomal protein S12 methylthiotransferase RimO [Treponema sp.]
MLTKTFFIDLHGCSKNQVDAEIINGIMLSLGWTRAEEARLADLIIINSCGFIEDAKRESINSIIEFKTSFPSAKIILAGCLAERYPKEFSENMEELDGVFGNGDLSKLPDLIAFLYPQDNVFKQNSVNYKRISLKKPLIKPEQIGISCGKRPEFFNFKASAYIKITEGCNNCCSFCAIPIIRGNLRSREVSEIVSEIKEFIGRGIYEFNLVGQDLGVFGMTDYVEMPLTPLSVLLSEISKLEGNFVIRLLYIHPDHFPLDILPVMAKDERFLPYFDIPFQSGSDSIIKKMNRKGSFEKYLTLVSKIREAFTDTKYSFPIIRTTFLVGFPGETEEDFEMTKKLLLELKCLWSGVFAYSKEEDTPSFIMKNHIKERIKKRRVEILQEQQSNITTKLLEVFVGKTFYVLIEELIENEKGLAIGRAWFQAPEVDGAIVVNFNDDDVAIDGKLIEEGALVKVKLTKVLGFDLEGVVVH